MGFAEFSDQASRWFSFCFHRQSCPENRSTPAVTKGFEIGRPNWTRPICWGKQHRTKRDLVHDSDGRRKNSHFRFPNPIQRAGSGIGKSHPFVRSAPSFRPDLRTISAVARSGGQGWPVFGPPLQRRAASLTAASTTACSVASGNRSPNSSTEPSKRGNARPSKSVITLTAGFTATFEIVAADEVGGWSG